MNNRKLTMYLFTAVSFISATAFASTIPTAPIPEAQIKDVSSVGSQENCGNHHQEHHKVTDKKLDELNQKLDSVVASIKEKDDKRKEWLAAKDKQSDELTKKLDQISKSINTLTENMQLKVSKN